MHPIRLVLCTLIALLIPSVACAAEADPAVTGSDLAQGAGVIATIIAIAGVASRLLSKSAPLHFWLPARAKWVPDALAAFLGVLLVALPEASTLLGQVEVGLMAVLMGAIAAAPGHAAPQDGATSTPTKAGTTLLVLFLAGLLGSGCAWLQENRGAIEDASGKVETLTDADWLVCSQVPAKDRDFCLAMATALRAGNAAVKAALAEALEGQACPVPSAAGSAAEPAP